MQALVNPMQTLFKEIKDNCNTFVLSCLVFSYQALKGDFPCTCKAQEGYCYAYMVIPSYILFALMFVMDGRFQRACRYTCWSFSSNFCWVLIRRCIKALCVSLLWVASVFFDAEWFVCCNNQNPRAVAELQCKAKKDITPQHGETVVTIIEMTVYSRLIGIAFLGAIILVCVILLPSWRIYRASSDRFRGLRCCSREVDIHELILEVGEETVVKAMKEKQEENFQEKVKEDLAAGKWVDYLEVAEELINPPRSQQRPGQEGPQRPGQEGPQRPGQEGPQRPGQEEMERQFFQL